VTTNESDAAVIEVPSLIKADTMAKELSVKYRTTAARMKPYGVSSNSSVA